MRLGVILAPMADPAAVIEAARVAEAEGLDAVGLWDHYHSGQPDWAYAAGWSVLGALATATERVQIVPMVLNGLLHDVGRLAKETAMLDLLSGGRFELGIGIGDWPEAFAAWGQKFPPRTDRTARLTETLQALDALWQGEPVTTAGTHVRLDGAISTPTPSSPVRIVGGTGGSRRVLDDLAPLVDELNVYAEPNLIEAAREAADGPGRCSAVSVYYDWSWDHWPADPRAALAEIAGLGVDRAFLAIAGQDTNRRVVELAAAR